MVVCFLCLPVLVFFFFSLQAQSPLLQVTTSVTSSQPVFFGPFHFWKFLFSYFSEVRRMYLQVQLFSKCISNIFPFYPTWNDYLICSWGKVTNSCKVLSQPRTNFAFK